MSMAAARQHGLAVAGCAGWWCEWGKSAEQREGARLILWNLPIGKLGTTANVCSRHAHPSRYMPVRSNDFPTAHAWNPEAKAKALEPQTAQMEE
ncbi:hypothetical protein BDZ91DRAFT_332149 [Kalaharituber pfeilii]|nr:hypothetical protein BDZ91DRAFT_332149 [Kalaharituber pfeilii]